MFAYHEIPPSRHLSRYIECFWSLESSQTSASGSPQRIPPDGRIEIVINLADPFKRHGADRQTEWQSKTIVAGQMRSYATVEPTGRIDLFGIRFQTGGACVFFGLPLTALTDRILPLDDLWRRQAEELEERTAECVSLVERAKVAEAVLSRRLFQPDSLDTMVEEGVRRIRSESGCFSTRGLLRGMGISERQLERRFKAKVGLGPQKLFRILRFQRVFAAHQENQLASWSSLAHECGYYDQAHLIRDFKAFSGQSPASYFQQEPDFTRHFTRGSRMSDFYNTDD